MSGPKLVYLAALAIYLLFFVLFSRFFFWKRYSESKFWQRKPKLSLEKLLALAKERGLGLPFISIMVPARNEAAVIEKTINHLASLNYDPGRFEIVVVTDAKERQQSDADQKHFILDTLWFFSYALEGNWRGSLRPHVKELITGLMADLCLDEYRDETFKHESWLLPQTLVHEPPQKTRQLLYELAREASKEKGKISLRQVYRLFRRHYPGLTDKEIEQIYPNYLCLVVPIIERLCYWSNGEEDRLLQNLVYYSVKADHRITQEIVFNLAKMIGARTEERIAELLKEGTLKEKLTLVFPLCYPSTQQVVERAKAELERENGRPVIKHVEVPDDFDGRFRGHCLGTSFPSTKGRALNYALPLAVDERTVMHGFYDAESRPDPDVLLYVAWRRLSDPPEQQVRIFQGPVFQVRNFYDLCPLSKLAGLYQTISHDWYLPLMFRRLPFVGGTNLYIERDLLEELEGYDASILTEDLELGTRAYLKTGAWPEYLPYASSEQTPATMQGFYRQRLRWGTGFLQVMEKITKEQAYSTAKKKPLLRELFIKGPLEWGFFQCATLVPPLIMMLWLFGQVDPGVVPNGLRHVINGLSFIYIGFAFYAYFRYRKYLDMAARPPTWYGQGFAVAQLLFLPLASFFFPIPFTSALLLKGMNRHPTAWAKTERSRE